MSRSHWRHFLTIIAIGVAFSSSQIKASEAQKSEVSATKAKEYLVLSAISEPENNMVREFKIICNDANEIEKLNVIPEKGTVLSYGVEEILKNEVVVATYAGLNSVYMKAVTLNASDVLLKVRYLKSFPGSYEGFELMLKKQTAGGWKVFESKKPQPVNWVYFRAKSFLGATVGIDSYDFHQEKPALAH